MGTGAVGEAVVRKGHAREVQRDEHTTLLDNATRPLHGRSHAEMNVLRRRVNLPGRDQQAIFAIAARQGVQVRHLRPSVPTLEDVFAKAVGE